MVLARRRLFVLWLRGDHLYWMVVGLSLLVGVWLYSQPAIWTNLPLSGLVSGKKVAIDAGHGGDDPGARSREGLLEKELNLDIALRLKRFLSRVNVYCVMIRETDCDFSEGPEQLRHQKRQDLINRVRMAGQSGADIYLSLHANSFPESRYRGAQTFYGPGNPDSRRLAEAIQKQLVGRLGPNNRRAKPGNFRVLQDSRMPAAIIEVGFLSNPEEAALLGRPEYRERVAEAICQGVIDYFSGRG
jgi:N-acetylmuramoyl-L-alanine amidase